jgi:phosphopantetheinyl transferase (holo-ACP synthase)
VIGNDVIDIKLAAIESNWRRKGYLNKIFHPDEQAQVLNAENPDLVVWTLWSMKEAAYKAIGRMTGQKGYFPLKLRCYISSISNTQITGKVVFGNLNIYTATAIVPASIHTIAAAEHLHLDQLNPVPSDTELIKLNGLPYTIINENVIPVSVSHHGRFHKVIYQMPSLDLSLRKASAIS